MPVPPSDLLVYRRRRPTPYVMSDTDITRLLSAASQRPRPLTAATYHTLVGLMAVTGMRVGEAVGLDVDDVDLDSGVILIRETKHHKARRIRCTDNCRGVAPVFPTAATSMSSTESAVLLRLQPGRQDHHPPCSGDVRPAGRPCRASAPSRGSSPGA